MFYSEIPDKIVIKNSEIKDKATKVLKELANINETILNKLNYTNDKPIDEDGNIIDFIDYEYNLSEAKYQKQAENRQKKYNDIISIRNESNLSILYIIENVKTDDLSLIALEDMWFRMNYKDLPKEQKNVEDVQWIKKKIQKKLLIFQL